VRIWPAIFALAATACSGKSRIALVTQLEGDTAVEILLFGKDPLAHGTGDRITFEAPDKVRGMYLTEPTSADIALTGHIVARVATACGPIDYCVRITKGDPLGGVLATRKRPGFDQCAPTTVKVLVDNRGGPARRLVVGGFGYAIPADRASTLDVQAPQCPAMTKAALDGAEIGELPVVEDHREWAYYDDLPRRTVLIDPGGTRCYRMTTGHYAPHGGGADEGPRTQELAGKKIYDLDTEITELFRPLPESIESVGGYGARTSLVECK
jgi:hypothetical protein